MICRVEERPTGWVIIDRRAVDDNRLSWAARGLLVYLLGRPDDWHVRPAHLARQSGSTYQVRKLLRELETTGYARLERRRLPDGTLTGSRWIIDEGGFYTRAPDKVSSGPDPPPGGIDRDSESPTSGNRRIPEGSSLPNKEELPIHEASTTDSAHSSARTEAVVAEEKDREELLALLTGRGVERQAAEALVAEHPPDRIRRHVARYDRARREGHARSVGWLIAAIRRNWSADAAPPRLFTPSEAVAFLERHGFSLNAQRTLDYYFERVPTDDGLRLRPRREDLLHVQ